MLAVGGHSPGAAKGSMPSYSDQQIADVRERSDIAEIIGRRVTLKKTGKDYQGLCPFHGEKTPSFYVVPGKQFWNCFGCGEHGDVFKFFMKLDGLSFVDALKHVATEAGVPLVEERFDPEEAKRKHHLDELAGLLERAVKFYELKLEHPSGEPAREHLRQRGITDEYIRKFHLGFAGAGMDDLARALAKAGVPDELAIEAGLCSPSRRGGRPFDSFHGRLIVPIRVPRPPDGRTVAMGGRFLEGVTDVGSTPGRKLPKYINSRETPLYHKGHVLFGLDQARDAIRKEERAVIVEGYFDVIGVHQAGLPLAVATCGTSLTESHLDLLMRTAAKEIIFLFDGDDAGVRAATRAAEMCARTQVPARVATLPKGLDPDVFARERGIEALRALLDRARPAVEMLIDHALNEAGPNPSVEERVRTVHAVRGIVMAASTDLARELYIGQIAQKLGVGDAIVKAALAQPATRPARPARPGPARVDRGPHGPVGPRRTTSSGPPETTPPPTDAEAPPPETSDVPLPPARPVPEPRAVLTPLARRTLSAEEGITLALLKYPVLAATVAQEGGVTYFGNPALKHLAERVIQLQQDNELPDGLRLVEELHDEGLKGRLRRAMAEADATLEQTADHLSKVIIRLQAEIDRSRARAEYREVQAKPDAFDDPEFRARLRETQAQRRERHRRKREQDRRP
jgi:DNA primase